jgi:hypothetical protein
LKYKTVVVVSVYEENGTKRKGNRPIKKIKGVGRRKKIVSHLM